MTRIIDRLFALLLVVVVWGCQIEKHTLKSEATALPTRFNDLNDSSTIARHHWKQYFADKNLIALIDTALSRNQELNISLQEIIISQNEVRARKGEYLPFVGLRAGAGIEKTGRYTRNGAVEENLEIKPGTRFPEPLNDYTFGGVASWEVDVWKKLRNAKKASALRYMATMEGRRFLVTNLIAEIADSYYELMALDNLLAIIQKNVTIQNDVLQIVRQQKDAARLTQLAVNRFEAQLLHTKNLQYEIQQRIVETENHISLLTGGYPAGIVRNSDAFNDIVLDSLSVGLPSQLLTNRPDIRQAELQLAASKLDVKVARANFFPSLRLTAGIGFQAFNTAYLMNPESLLYSLAGDLVAPLVNRNAIKALYNTASAKQVQQVYNYERTLINAYIEVANQMAKVKNTARSYETKSREVEILTQSVDVSNSLFKSARADYLEVLLTQREALESRMELVEIKRSQMNAKVNIYRALGGGWN